MKENKLSTGNLLYIDNSEIIAANTIYNGKTSILKFYNFRRKGFIYYPNLLS